MKPGRIRGVPGAGKTREIVGLIQRAADKYGPDRVGAVAYTKAGAEELKDRAISQAGYSPDEAFNIRTIHSHCWTLLGMTRERHAEANIKSFNEDHPAFSVSIGTVKEDSGIDGGRGNRLLAEMNIARLRRLPFEKYSPDVAMFASAWLGWMAENDLVDYTGMIEKAVTLNMAPDIDVLFVDEAQDMSALVKDLTWMWAQDTVSTVWCGDSDQAIFKFAGADPNVFDSLPCEWSRTLKKSWRLPGKICEFANSILGLVAEREDITVEPTEGAGEVLYTQYPDLSLPGSHMILCRCNYQVSGWISWLIEQGRLWHNPYRPTDLAWNPAGIKGIRAVVAYNKLLDGGELSLPEIKTLVASTKSKGNLTRGAKAEVKEMDVIEKPEDIFSIQKYDLFKPGFFDEGIPVSDKFSLGKTASRIVSRGGMVDQSPSVIVGTIHSVKGGEADHVWLDCALSFNINAEVAGSLAARDDELRVFYVGATRARATLGLINYHSGVMNA